jgi:transcriptional regulator with AAA-type ATPase domain/PAS domain-containing protein
MVDEKDCDHETENVDAANETSVEGVILPFNDKGVNCSPENAKYHLLFREEATVKLLTQETDQKGEVKLWRLGMCHAGVIVWEWDLKTKEIRAEGLAEGPPFYYESLKGNTWEDIAHEDDRERVLEALQRFEEMGYVSFDCFFRLATEIPRWVHARDMQLVLDANQEPTTVIGIFFDATESQLAKEHVCWGQELPQDDSEDKFNWHRMFSELDRHEDDRIRIDKIRDQCADQFGSMMAVSDVPAFLKDTDLKCLALNKAFMSFVGLSSEEIFKLGDEAIWGKEESDYLERLCRRALNGESVTENHVRNINGKLLEFRDEVYPHWGYGGEVFGVWVIIFRVEPEDGPGAGQWPYRTRISSHMQSIDQKVHLAAHRNCVVLLTGESGSGKDYLARRIHDLSKRADQPFLNWNSGGSSPYLIESDLFGHEKGAFTGAIKQKKGLAELAGHGTLFLNEIGDLPLELQTKLLTFLDERTFSRLGGEKTLECHARIVAATNRKLRQEVAEGRFRKDLFYRLNVLAIEVPPLRQRREDIPSIVRELLPKLATINELEYVPELDGSAMNKLLGYHWPGNIRELGNVLEYAIIHANSAEIGADHILFDTDEEDDTGSFRDLETSKSPLPLRNPSNKEIKALYDDFILQKGGSSTDIAKYCDVDDSTVRKWFQKAKLPLRKAGRPKKKSAE